MKNKFISSINMYMIMLLCSCSFNITDDPGPQMSHTIRSAKLHDTFICAFTTYGKK